MSDAELDAIVSAALTEAAPTPTDPIDDVRATLAAMMAVPTPTMPPPTPTDPADALQATLVAIIAAPTPTPVPTATPRPTPRPTYTPRPTAMPTRAPRPTPTPTVADLVARLKPSIARIVTARSTGSGFVYDARGLVATNAHVVDCCRDVAVILNGRRYEGRVLGRNDAADLAVVQLVAGGGRFPSTSFGSAGRVAVGDDVIALGFPLDLMGDFTVTRGIVSSHRSYDGYNFIQTDAAINFGNSGGPLINKSGEVIGMNTSKRLDAEGVGFALSVAEIEHRLPGLSGYAAAPAPTPRPVPTPCLRPTATPQPYPDGATAITNVTLIRDDSHADWSPDGRRIVFASNRTGNIHVINADGSDVTQLTHNSDGNIDPAWSPDGRRIAFTLRRGGWEIYVMNADGSDVTQLTHDSRSGSPAWSPDCRRIAFASSGKIHVMNVDGSDVTQLTHDSYNPASEPAWSPDGHRIAFASGPYRDREIYVMNADGSDVTQLTHDSRSSSPAWSPDGLRIAFTSYSLRGSGDIYVMNADGSDVTQLTHDSYSPASEPAWSPDGLRIAFTSDRRASGRVIYVIAAPP